MAELNQHEDLAESPDRASEPSAKAPPPSVADALASLAGVFDRRRLRTGVLIDASGDAAGALGSALEAGFDFAVFDLASSAGGDFAFSARELRESAWTTQVVGRALSAPVGGDDQEGERALRHELAWARHLALPAVIARFDGHRSDPAGYAHALEPIFGPGSTTRVWLSLPATEEGWRWWASLSRLLDYPERLGICLELDGRAGTSSSQPSLQAPTASEIAFWIAEPVECVLASESGFMKDPSGRIALDAPRCELLLSLFSRNTVSAVVAPLERRPLGPGAQRARQALAELFAGAWQGVGGNDRFRPELADQLVPPPEPLKDDLPSSTYEHMEDWRDKRALYREAIGHALRKIIQSGKASAVVAVAGAGRGQLVDAALDASRDVSAPIRIYALEKSPMAAITLRHRRQSDWDQAVTVVEVDIRRWDAPENADLIVSELLGSFGDNELFPECLDGAQRFLAPGGIMIPGECTSYLAPLCSSSLFARVGSSPSDRERPYGVTRARGRILAPPEPCFHFAQPSSGVDRTKPSSHHRFARLRFEARSEGLVHGFAGYFEAPLFGGVTLGTHPSRTSAGSSWSPIYFPVRAPFHVREGTMIECQFWRCVGEHRVWYEWAVTEPEAGPLHNPRGRSSAMSY